MSNRYRPYLIVLPEDRANEQIINGFIDSLRIDGGSVEVEHYAGGWMKVLEKFKRETIHDMEKYTESIAVLIMDFDKDIARLERVKSEVPEDLKNRVFVFGVLSEPEDLKRSANMSLERIGKVLAEDCPGDGNDLWTHPLLQHNIPEISRILPIISPFLFQ